MGLLEKLLEMNPEQNPLITALELRKPLDERQVKQLYAEYVADIVRRRKAYPREAQGLRSPEEVALQNIGYVLKDASPVVTHVFIAALPQLREYGSNPRN